MCKCMPSATNALLTFNSLCFFATHVLMTSTCAIHFQGCLTVSGICLQSYLGRLMWRINSACLSFPSGGSSVVDSSIYFIIKLLGERNSDALPHDLQSIFLLSTWPLVILSWFFVWLPALISFDSWYQKSYGLEHKSAHFHQESVSLPHLLNAFSATSQSLLKPFKARCWN